MSLDLISIGNRIRFYRLQKEWTLLELSNKSGISLQQIGHLERGERSFSLDSLIRRVSRAP